MKFWWAAFIDVYLFDAISSDKKGIHTHIFLIFSTSTCYGYSLESLIIRTHNAYNKNPQHMFSWRNKITIITFQHKKKKKIFEKKNQYFHFESKTTPRLEL